MWCSISVSYSSVMVSPSSLAILFILSIVMKFELSSSYRSNIFLTPSLLLVLPRQLPIVLKNYGKSISVPVFSKSVKIFATISFRLSNPSYFRAFLISEGLIFEFASANKSKHSLSSFYSSISNSISFYGNLLSFLFPFYNYFYCICLFVFKYYWKFVLI